MKRMYSFLFWLIAVIPCFSQNVSPDIVASRLSEYVTNAHFDEANDYFQKYHKELDSTTADIFYSVINIGLASQNKKIDDEANVSCIKRVINEFSAHKEELRNMPNGMMGYFNIYVSYLSKIGNPFYLNVYKLFKDIWPTIEKENAQIYIYVLENTSIQAFIDLKYNEAIPIFEELIEMGNHGYQLSSKPYTNYYCLGRCYQNTDKDEKAASAFDKSLTLFSASAKTNDSITYINVVRDRYEVALKLSQLTKCIELGNILIQFYDKKDEYIQDLINVSISLAEIELSMFKTSEGILNYENGVKYILLSDNYNEESRKGFLKNLYTLYNTSNIKEENRKFKEFRDKYKIASVGKIEPGVMDEHYIDSLWSIVNKQNDNIEQIDIRSYTNAINILARYYSNRGQELYGIQLLERTIDYYKKTNIVEQSYAILYSSLGSIYSLVQNIDKAKENYITALQIYERNGMYNADYVDILSSLADNSLQSGELVAAKAYLEEAHEISEHMSAFSTEKTIYYHLLSSFSELYKTMEDEEKALSYNASIIDDIIKSNGDKIIKKTFQVARVLLLLYFDRFNEAYSLMKDIGDDYFNQFNDWWTPFEVKYFNGDMTCEKDLESLSQADRQNIQRIFSSFTPSMLENYWDITGGNLNSAYSMALDKFNTPSLRVHTYDNLLFTKTFQLEVSKYLKKSNGKMTVEVIKDIEERVSNMVNVQENLNDNDIAIEFFIVNHRPTFKEIYKKYGALILRKDMSAPVFIELCDIDSLGNIIYSNTLGEATDYSQKYYDLSNTEIYDKIWKPLENEIIEGSNIYISGSGATLFVNFSALSNGRKRIGEIYNIHNVFSTSMIKSTKNSNHYQTAIIYGGIDYNTSLDEMANEASNYSHTVFSGDVAMYRGIDERGSWGNLKYSLVEANNIEMILNDKNMKVSKYIGTKASEESFKALSGISPDLIHISTHGYYYQPYIHSFRSDYKNSYFSMEYNKQKYNGLLFSGANNAWKNNQYKENVDDGVLTAEEISLLDLSHTSLVTLSACQTGLGEVNDIDGNNGLLRAFKIAGVKDVIITLWNVSDSATSYFMESFYNNLFESNEAKTALDKTVEKIKEEMPDPYYWAPFVIFE